MRRLFLSLLFVGCFIVFTDGSNLSDASGTLTTGATSQQLLPAATVPRTFFFFQNISAGTMWLGFGATAVQNQPSVQVLAGAIFRMDNVVSDDVINVIGVTTADKFVCKYR